MISSCAMYVHDSTVCDVCDGALCDVRDGALCDVVMVLCMM